jgi:hypothetical protein
MEESDLPERSPKGPFSQFMMYSRHNQEDRHFSESENSSNSVTRKIHVRFFQRIPFLGIGASYVARSRDIDFASFSRRPPERRDSMRVNEEMTEKKKITEVSDFVRFCHVRSEAESVGGPS